jgi:CRISPR type III-A-associated RAMP protein Csm4
METVSVLFRPRGALASAISSDTLFGAVCWGMQALGLKPDLAEWLGAAGAPPFAFSAPLPVWLDGEGARVRFYPRPASFEARLERSAPTATKEARLAQADGAKERKGLEWVSAGALALIATGALRLEEVGGESSPVQVWGQALLTDAEAAALTGAGIDKGSNFWGTGAVQRNHIDRVLGATVEGLLFYQVETAFHPQAGLWALLRAEQADLDGLIRPALRYLADTGLGGKRAVGKGQFDIWIEATPPKLPHPANANAVMLLSRYLPAEDELAALNAPSAAYRLVTLRPKREQKFARDYGTATPPIYKGMVRMFEPGAVFPLPGSKPIYGRLAEVVTAADGGPVYQSGAAIPLPIHVQEG